MSDKPPLRSRLRRSLREAGKFGAVGVVGFLVNVAVFNLCISAFRLAPVRSGVIATALAIGVNYLGNRYWTYRHCDKSQVRREAGLFLLFSCIGLVIENGILALSHYGFGFTTTLADNVAKYVVGLGTGTLFRFWSYRTWVFRLPAPPAAAPAAGGRGDPSGHDSHQQRSEGGGSGIAARTAEPERPVAASTAPYPSSGRPLHFPAEEQGENRRSLL